MNLKNKLKIIDKKLSDRHIDLDPKGYFIIMIDSSKNPECFHRPAKSMITRKRIVVMKKTAVTITVSRESIVFAIPHIAYPIPIIRETNTTIPTIRGPVSQPVAMIIPHPHKHDPI